MSSGPPPPGSWSGSWTPPPAIGPYRVRGVVGRGGAGVVLGGVAPDGREVAIKLLTAPDVGARLQRFGREERLLRELAAEGGFVPLLDRGESPWGPYLVMPFLAGGTLLDRLRRGPLGQDEAVRVVTSVAEALARAHERGIVHRDLKPANVLFAADGRPLVADLGIAKAADVQDLSRTGETLGTWGYMAPEQATDAKSVGPPADVFALGVLLHECLTALPAFPDQDPVALAEALATRRVAPLRSLRPELPSALERLVLTALDPDPRRRPSDARLFLRALSAALAPPPPPRAAGRLVLPLVVLGLGATAAGWVLLDRRGPPPGPAPVEPPPTAAPPPAPAPTQPGLRLLATWGRAAPQFVMVNRVAWCPATGVVASGGIDGVVTLADLASGEELAARTVHAGTVEGLAFSADGAALVSVGADGLQVSDGRSLAPRFQPARARGLTLTSLDPLPHGRWLTGAKGEVLIWDVGKNEPVMRLPVAGAEEGCAARASADGKVAAVWHDAQVDVFDLELGRRRGTVRGPEPISSADLSEDGRRLAAVTQRGALVAWELAGGAELTRLRAITPERNRAYGTARVVRFLPGGRKVLVGGDDEAVRCWDLERSQELSALTGHVGWIADIQLLPEGRVLTCGNDQTVRLWRLSDGTELTPRLGHAGHVQRVAWAPDGLRACSAGWDCTVRTWEVATGKQVDSHGAGEPLQALAVAPDRVCAARTAVWTWGETTAGFSNVSAPVHTLAFLHGPGREGGLLVVDEEGGLRTRDMTPAWERDLGPRVAGRAAALAPDEGSLLLLGHGGSAGVLPLPPTGEVRSLAISNATAGAFLGPGSVVLGDAQGRLRRFQLADGTPRTWGEDAPGSLITCLAASADGAHVVAGHMDGTLRLWDAAQERELDRLALPRDIPTALAVSPQGDELLVGTRRGVVLRAALRRSP